MHCICTYTDIVNMLHYLSKLADNQQATNMQADDAALKLSQKRLFFNLL